MIKGLEYISMSWDSGRDPTDMRHVAKLTFNFKLHDHDGWLAGAKLGQEVAEFIEQKMKGAL